MIGTYVIVRTYSAGVFAGTLISRNGKEVELSNARRIWYWEGAASLSKLAVSGVSKPQNCKFPVEVSRVILTEAIEVIAVSDVARASIAGVAVWDSLCEDAPVVATYHGFYNDDAGSGAGSGSGFGDDLGTGFGDGFGAGGGYASCDGSGAGSGSGFGFGEVDAEGEG